MLAWLFLQFKLKACIKVFFSFFIKAFQLAYALCVIKIIFEYEFNKNNDSVIEVKKTKDGAVLSAQPLRTHEPAFGS